MTFSRDLMWTIIASAPPSPITRLMQSLRLPYSAGQLLNCVRKHFPQQRLVLVYQAGPTGFGLYDELEAAGLQVLLNSFEVNRRAGRLIMQIRKLLTAAILTLVVCSFANVVSAKAK